MERLFLGSLLIFYVPLKEPGEYEWILRSGEFSMLNLRDWIVFLGIRDAFMSFFLPRLDYGKAEEVLVRAFEEDLSFVPVLSEKVDFFGLYEKALLLQKEIEKEGGDIKRVVSESPPGGIFRYYGISYRENPYDRLAYLRFQQKLFMKGKELLAKII